MSQRDAAGAKGTQSPRDVLAAAERRLVQRIKSLDPLLPSDDPARAEGYLATLCDNLAQVMKGSEATPIRESVASSPMYPPLMDALLHELIEGADEQKSQDSTVVALRAWCALRSPATEATASAKQPSGSLPERMRGPDAFELLVEVAHDFRSPLTSILFLAEALRDGHSGPVTQVQRSQLGLIYSAAFGLAAIASDIMDHAREEKDLIGGEPEPFSLRELFLHVERMVKPIVEEKALELRIVVPDRWPSHGHRHALSRVLLNLTTNALKFTDEGVVELGVRALPRARLEFYVQDTGRGMSLEEQRTLFEPFRRRGARAGDGHHFSGSGIGLSIARRLLRAMGSELTLDASDDSGTRFSFVLPASGH